MVALAKGKKQYDKRESLKEKMTNAIWRVCLKDNMSKLGSLVRERILILDGAMGTMIQQYNLTEEDFRGERFSQIPGQMKGNNDLLCLTRPDVIQDIHRKVSGGRCGYYRNKYIPVPPASVWPIIMCRTMCVR